MQNQVARHFPRVDSYFAVCEMPAFPCNCLYKSLQAIIGDPEYSIDKDTFEAVFCAVSNACNGNWGSRYMGILADLIRSNIYVHYFTDYNGFLDVVRPTDEYKPHYVEKYADLHIGLIDEHFVIVNVWERIGHNEYDLIGFPLNELNQTENPQNEENKYEDPQQEKIPDQRGLAQEEKIRHQEEEFRFYRQFRPKGLDLDRELAMAIAE